MSPLFLATAFCVLLSGGGAEECNEDRLRGCVDSGLRDAAGSGGCASLRSNFDCALWQVSMCDGDRQGDRGRDAVSKMWRHLQTFCEADSNWYARECFQSTEVKRCEAMLPSRGQSTDYSSCRSYGAFRECASSVVGGCGSDDRRLLGTFLADKGGRRAWTCPTSAASSTSPLSPQIASFGEARSLSSSGDCESTARECVRQFEDSERDSRTHHDSDMRHHTTCCALVNYEECLGERCRSRELVQEVRSRYPYVDCADHTTAECSDADRPAALVLTLVAAVAATALRFALV